MKTSHETLTEAGLLQRMLDLDEAAWREFQRRYDRMIWTCIHRVVSRFNSVVSSDAIQEIRGSFYASLLANDMHKLRCFEVERGNKLGSWVGLIAINAAWDHLRACSRRPSMDTLAVADELPHGDADVFERSATREDFEHLAEVVGDLSGRDRDFIRLYYIDGCSPQEIADILGMNVKSVYTKKHRLSRQLRDAFARRQDAARAPVSAAA